MPSLPPIYSTCGRCKNKVLVIWGGTIKQAKDGTFILACPFCEERR